jgi:TPR repeat protein
MFRFVVAMCLAWVLVGSALAQRNLAVAPAAASEQRVALVIGNGAYKVGPLRNPVNDATDVAASLRSLGFTVILRTNASRRQMVEAMREFGGQLKRGGVGFFYYAGHGVQSRGANYLIPVGASIQSDADLEFESFDAGQVLAQMEQAGNRVNIVVLDACRDNPFARGSRSASRGLAQMDAAKGTFLAYATSPGSTAADGTGRNGIYTKHLLASLKHPDTKLEEVFKRVRLEVANETGNKQIPWDASSVLGDFHFRGGPAGAPAVEVATIAPVSSARVPEPELDSADFIVELDAYLKKSSAPVSEVRRSMEAGSTLAKARWCALATHERFNVGIPPSDGIPVCKELAEANVPLGMYLYGRVHAEARGVPRNYAESVKWFRFSAEGGHPAGMTALAVSYFHGHGVSQSDAEAVRWAKLGIEKGAANAMALLGFMHENGRGVAASKDEAMRLFRSAADKGFPPAMTAIGNLLRPTNPGEAVRWYRSAADAGEERAMSSLGHAYLAGSGIERNPAEALKWLRSAADKGDAYAMSNLAVYYGGGQGGERNPGEAFRWARMAAEKGDVPSMFSLGRYYLNGLGTQRNENEGARWLRTAAEKGHVSAMSELGRAFIEGKGVEKNGAEAVRWLRAAADKGNVGAMDNMAYCYATGCVTKDEREAVRWARMAADKGSGSAASRLGQYYLNGRGVEKDPAEAVRWLKIAVEKGVAAAMTNLGYAHENGLGVEKSESEAARYYRMAAEKDEVAGMRNLGNMYEHGRGIARDLEQAVSWYRRAAAAGNERAKQDLARLKR